MELRLFLEPRLQVVCLLYTSNTELYTQLSLENGFIPVNEKMETEIPGVYAAGDIRVKQVRQVSTAVADGTIAAIYAAMQKNAEKTGSVKTSIKLHDI